MLAAQLLTEVMLTGAFTNPREVDLGGALLLDAGHVLVARC